MGYRKTLALERQARTLRGNRAGRDAGCERLESRVAVKAGSVTPGDHVVTRIIQAGAFVMTAGFVLTARLRVAAGLLHAVTRVRNQPAHAQRP